MNSRQKGRKFEKLCKRKLDDAGWLTYLVPPKQRFAKQEDVFGKFDLVALRGKVKLYVQVTCNTTRGRLKSLEEFKVKHLLIEDMVQLWVHKDKDKDKGIKSGWKIYDI